MEKIKNTEGSEMSVSLLVVKMVCSLFKFWLSVQCSECRPTIGYNNYVYAPGPCNQMKLVLENQHTQIKNSVINICVNEI